MLEVKKLSKRFKDKTAVEDLDLFMNKGESIGLLGPNGAGKSTTISMIASLVKPTSGDVLLNGKSVTSNPGAIRKVMGVVPQEIALYEELSANENLNFFGSIYGLKGKKLKARVDDALEIVGLADRRKEQIKKYSGGMKRRINIAAALLHEPEIIIMDEPTVGIDPQSRNHILETVRLLNREKGTTVLYTSHYMEEVEQLCTRMYIMDHGKVIASGSKEELQSYLSDDDILKIQVDKLNDQMLEELKAIEVVKQVEQTEDGLKLIIQKQSRVLAQVVQIAERSHVQITNMHVETPKLEDVFLHLTGRTLRD